MKDLLETHDSLRGNCHKARNVLLCFEEPQSTALCNGPVEQRPNQPKATPTLEGK